MIQTAGRTRVLAFGAVFVAGALVTGVGCTKKNAADVAAPTTTAESSTTSTAKSSGTTTTSGSTSDTVAQSASDQKAAEASLITLADAPSGYTAGASSSSDSENPFVGLPACAPFEQALGATNTQRTAKATATFKDAAGDELDNQVEVYTSEQIAKDSADTLADPDFPACLQAALGAQIKSGLKSGTTLDSITAKAANVESASGLGIDAVSAFTVEIAITTQGRPVTLQFGFVMMTYGRSVSQVSTQGTSLLDIAPTVQAAAKSLKANAPS